MSETKTGQASVRVDTPELMHAFGRELGRLLRSGDLVLLTGDLGAGKTTLTRGIGEGMGVRGQITSPTFVIARTHPSLTSGPALVHVDAYRLGDSGELEDLDIDFQRSAVVAEWGAGLVDASAVALEIMIARPTGAEIAENRGESGRGAGVETGSETLTAAREKSGDARETFCETLPENGGNTGETGLERGTDLAEFAGLSEESWEADGWDAAETPVETRQLTFRAQGERWQQIDFAALYDAAIKAENGEQHD